MPIHARAKWIRLELLVLLAVRWTFRYHVRNHWIVAILVASQEVPRLCLTTVSRSVAILVVSQEVRRLFLTTVSRIVAILMVSQEVGRLSGGFDGGSKAGFDDSFQDRSDFRGSARGSKGVFDDSL